MAINNQLNTATVPVPVAKGGTGVASNTAYAVLCGGTTSTGAIQSIASVGSAKQVLKSNGAGALPTFQSQDFLLLDTASVSSATASVEFTDLSSTYFVYKFEIQNFNPTADGDNLNVRLSIDNGSTFISSASSYIYTNTQYNTAFANNSATTTFMNIALATSNSATVGFSSLELYLINPTNSAVYTTMVGTGININSTATTQNNVFTVGRRLNAEDNDAIQFYTQTSTIESVEIRMYGLINA